MLVVCCNTVQATLLCSVTFASKMAGRIAIVAAALLLVSQVSKLLGYVPSMRCASSINLQLCAIFTNVTCCPKQFKV